MTSAEVEKKAAQIKVLKNRQDQLQAEIDKLEESLKEELTKRGVEEIIAGAFKVIWKTVFQNRLDTKMLKAKDPKTYNDYSIVSSYRKFTVI